MDINIAKELSIVATEARRKANYLRCAPADRAERNYEQCQTSSDVLEEVAQKVEHIIAKYAIYYQLFDPKQMEFKDEVLQQAVTRQCKTAIRKTLQRAEIR